MAIFTFSTKTKKPEDTRIVEEVKQYCDDNCINFSAVVIQKLREFNLEVKTNGKRH